MSGSVRKESFVLSGHNRRGAKMNRKKVVIIDDDKELLEELKVALDLSGYESVAVNDVDKAISVAKENKPDLVLLDLKMPKKSGLEIGSELVHLDKFKETPIIAMSAFYKEGDFPLLAVHGIKKCLHKPFTLSEVIEEIERLLGPV